MLVSEPLMTAAAAAVAATAALQRQPGLMASSSTPWTMVTEASKVALPATVSTVAFQDKARAATVHMCIAYALQQHNDGFP